MISKFTKTFYYLHDFANFSHPNPQKFSQKWQIGFHFFMILYIFAPNYLKTLFFYVLEM